MLVRTKFHAFSLKKFLNEQPEIKENKIIADQLTGQGPAEQLCLPGTLQGTVLKHFRQGFLFKVLIYSTVDILLRDNKSSCCNWFVR